MTSITYLREIEKAFQSKLATEHTYRPFLQTFGESFDDLEHYEQVVPALSQTIEIMQGIDETIEENGGFPIE